MKGNSPALRRTLLLYLLIPLVLLWVFSAMVTYFIARNYANIAYDRALFDSVESIEEQIRFKNGKAILKLPEIAWNILRFDQQDKVYFDVRQTDGLLLAGETDIPDPPPALRTVGQAIFHNGKMRGQAVRIASLYVSPDKQGTGRSGQVLVQVAETLNKRETLVNKVLWAVIVPQLFLILLAGASVWIVVSRALAPLEQLRDAIGNRSHLDLSPIQEGPAPREVQPLLRAINDLMQRLSQVLRVQRNFIADAAHQLRTPLAGLTTQTDLALRHTNPQDLQHALGQIRAGIERTNHLVDQLLALARAEAGPDMTPKFEPLDLNQLASAQTAEWVPHAIRKQIDLGYDGPGKAVSLFGDALLLRVMLANILDNAVRYTPPGGKITVHLLAGERASLTVEDSGPGIPASERERVFERFYRVADNGESGSGLGLAIVHEIARTHGARVWLEAAAHPGGTRVHIEF
ncbi:MAG: sensor histidine kinase N-terminal domain-containing protein [Sulfuricaulis sp.]